MDRRTEIQPIERQVVAAMGSILRLTLEDLRAQYRRLNGEAERLVKLGGAIAQIQAQLGNQRKEVITNHDQADPDRHVRRARVRASA